MEIDSRVSLTEANAMKVEIKLLRQEIAQQQQPS